MDYNDLIPNFIYYYIKLEGSDKKIHKICLDYKFYEDGILKLNVSYLDETVVGNILNFNDYAFFYRKPFEESIFLEKKDLLILSVLVRNVLDASQTTKNKVYSLILKAKRKSKLINIL